jgi:ABC-type dipeptide/oligopeptide/nickel transport system permease component
MWLWRYAARRCLWAVPSLLGITLLTLLLMDLAPSSREEIEIGNPDAVAADAGAQARAAKIRLLREHWGLIDPATGETYSVWRRWLHWLARACAFDLAGPGVDAEQFYGRIERALPVSLLLNALALLLALGVAIPLGARLGMARSGVLDRALSAGMFGLYCLPEFLLATLLLVVFGAASPSRCCRSAGCAATAPASCRRSRKLGTWRSTWSCPWWCWRPRHAW